MEEEFCLNKVAKTIDFVQRPMDEHRDCYECINSLDGLHYAIIIEVQQFSEKYIIHYQKEAKSNEEQGLQCKPISIAEELQYSIEMRVFDYNFDEPLRLDQIYQQARGNQYNEQGCLHAKQRVQQFVFKRKKIDKVETTSTKDLYQRILFLLINAKFTEEIIFVYFYLNYNFANFFYIQIYLLIILSGQLLSHQIQAKQILQSSLLLLVQIIFRLVIFNFITECLILCIYAFFIVNYYNSLLLNQFLIRSFIITPFYLFVNFNLQTIFIFKIFFGFIFGIYIQVIEEDCLIWEKYFIKTFCVSIICLTCLYFACVYQVQIFEFLEFLLEVISALGEICDAFSSF